MPFVEGRSADYDPETFAYWSLPMAVAWIAYRTKDAVRDAWAKYRAEFSQWRWSRYRKGFTGTVYEGWHLVQPSRPSLALLRLAGFSDRIRSGDTLKMSVKDAEASLWFCLREGSIGATGIGLQSERREQIAPLEWAELKPYEARNGTDEVRVGPSGTGYRDVELPAKRALSISPKPRSMPPSVSLPDTLPPAGDGYMPLFLAALWIATKGGTADFDPRYEAIWRPVFDELLAAIASDRVRAVGSKDGSRRRCLHICSPIAASTTPTLSRRSK